MKILARFFTLAGAVFLAPYYLGTFARWVRYGYENSHDVLFWSAFGCLVLGFVIRRIWKSAR